MSVIPTAPAPQWPDPRPLPPDLPPVQPFSPSLLPAAMRAWVSDIARRMQCPPDYIAVAAMVAAGAVIGRKIAIRPQARTDWAEVPNIWGCIVGRPGVMKSPAMAAALKPINRMEVVAQQENKEKEKAYRRAMDIFEIQKKAASAKTVKNIKDGKPPGDALDGISEPDPPILRRYVLNDASYEKAGVVAAHNPTGFLMFRDELVSFLKPLERDENAPARGFVLSAWNGTSAYTFDRIGRGTIYIEACCMSLLGSTQPAKLAEYLRHAVKGGGGDDGMAQRFQLLVWPDIAPQWENIDDYPDKSARDAVFALFERLDNLYPETVQAEHDPFEPLPFLRFDPAALSEFETWRHAHELRVRTGDLHPAMEAHLAKFRGMVPKLALILHLLDGGTGPVSIEPFLQALAWAEYLESHAARAYASVTAAKTRGAKMVLEKIRGGDLQSPFKARDVQRHNWSGLNDIEDVRAALDMLVHCDWLIEAVEFINGRPSTIYKINPKGLAQ